MKLMNPRTERRDSALFAALCRDLLAKGLALRFRARGQSMQPAVRDGEPIEVHPAPPEALRPGDILLTQGDDGFKAHRLVALGRDPSVFLTRGDSGCGVDPRGQGRILGKVIAVERNGHRIGLEGRSKVILQAMGRLAFRARAALESRARWVGRGGVACLLLFLATLFAASPALAQADLSVTETVAPAVVAPGGVITYTITLKNNSLVNNAANATLFMITPANTTFASNLPVPGGWACVNPGVGNPGAITCTINPFNANTTAVFTIAVTVGAGVAAGTTILQNVDSTSTTADPNGQNNSTTISVLVEPAAQADLAVSMTANPSTVFVFGTFTYNITVTNRGQANSLGVILTDVLPASVTFVSATPSQGSCSGTTTVTCPLGTINFGATATVAIVVTAPATSAMISNTASVTATTTDPVAGNNSATVIVVTQPLVCAMPAANGAGGTLAGVVNTYYPPAAGAVAAGSTSMTLGASSGIATPIAVGDLVLIIQMQDAAINSTNTGAYGDGAPGDPGSGYTSLNSSGLYEFVTATNAVPVAGGALNFTGTGSGGGLLNTYTSAAATGVQGKRTFQAIRVPQYQTATLGSTLAALAWTGTVGGVLAIDVAGQLTLNTATVSVNAAGFRGAAGRQLQGGAGANTDYITLASNAANGSKGEGFAGTPRFLTNSLFTVVTNTGVEGYPNGSYARGAPGNAGGGGTDGDPATATPNGNDENSGGGGGGNGGAGGIGGYAWNLPGIGQGFGGVLYPFTISGVVMGGAGGAGTTNNGTADPANANPAGINSSGAAGGGILFMRSGSVVGTATVTANGQTSLNVMNDGGGGGGAGGSIIFLALSGGIGGLTAHANGGVGGNTWLLNAPGNPYPGQRHGPGGGGGGGVVLLSGAAAAATATGGASGVTNTVSDSYGAQPGGAGVIQTTIAPSTTPGVRSGAECALADLQVTNAGSPNPVIPGNTITYTQVVKNNGPQDAVNATFSEAVPAGTTFNSLAKPAGWACVTPAVGGTGLITCTNPNVANGAAAGTFTLVVTVGAAITSGSVITDVASITSGTNDPNLSNNSATVMTLVAAATTADLTISNSASPNPVIAGNNITYTQIVMNNGPAAASPASFSEAIPANTTFQSLTPPAGWACSTPPVGGTGNINCTIGSIASGAFAPFSLVVQVNAGTPSGTTISDTVTTGSSTPDPNPSNNSATADVVVATAGQADLAISGTNSPNPVLAGNNETYAVTVVNNGPAAAAAPTFTDVLPAGTTFVSLTPIPVNWTCVLPGVGMTGTITCNDTLPLAVGGKANFLIVLQVIATTAPGTFITNTLTVSSTTSDPNLANNSVSLTTVVASPTQADVAVTKTGAPDPVNQNTTLVYTITVSNSGPAVATNVVATDTLPAAVTYLSSSTTLGGCVQAAGTVTCNLGTMSVGQVAVISISVNATTFSSASLATNSVTITHGESDPNSANNTATFTSTIQAPTAVQLASFRAVRLSAGGALVEWKTREEIRNLGFNLYREQGGAKTRLNPSLIAGAALTFRGGLPQHGAKTYQWLDPAASAGDATYVLESVEVNGTRSIHGPAALEEDAAGSAPRIAVPSRTLSQMSAYSAAAPSSSKRLQQPLEVRAPIEIAAGISSSSLASRPAVKISVSQEGWYSVTRAQLIAAGLHLAADSRLLHLFAEGVEQPIRIIGATSGPLGPNDAIEFYGTGIDTPFSGTRVYWLVVGERPGKRIGTAAVAGGDRAAPQSFPFTVQREDRTTYFAALLNGEDNDNFFGALITTTPVDQDLTVAHSDASFGAPALQVALQGVTDMQDHRVSVSLNGAFLGEMDFTNLTNPSQEFTLAPGQVQDGTNTVTLVALNGDTDVSLVQSIRLHFAHTYAADGNWLRMTAPAGHTIRVTGFTNPQIAVYDITDTLNVLYVPASVSNGPSGFGVTFSAPGVPGSIRTLLAFSGDQIAGPSGLAPHAPTVWGQPQRGADVVIITHPSFAQSLAPLVSLRQTQEHTVAVVPVDDLYDEFNFGERSPFALRAFLAAAASHWRTSPQSVLLVGDATFDPRNYLGFGFFDLVPTRIIQTAALKTASDDWFSDFHGNGYAKLPTGRLPVRTPGEAALVVSKIVGYETGASAGPWTSQVLLIGDQNNGYDFSGATNSVALLLPPSLGVTKILADGQDPAIVHQQLLAALGGGQLLVNYVGHGSVEQWSFADLFSGTDAASLTNGGNLPMVVSMDCLSGFFHDVFTTSLAESLLLAPNGGAVAVWASSGFTEPDPQVTMNRALVQTLFANPGMTIGRVILKAKAGTVDSDVRRTWILFGDPSMRLSRSAARR
jgi:uncharacterized repeat protein (TIGR01451 family)